MGLPTIRTEINLVFGFNDTICRCKLYFLVSAGDINVGNVDAVADEFRAVINAEAIAMLSSTSRFDGVEINHIDGSTAVQGRSTDAPDVGTVTSEILPEDDCVVIQRKSGTGGRSNRGRIFIPFIPETFQADSALTSTALTTYKAFAYKLKIPIVLATSGVTLMPQTINFKDGLCVPVTQTRVVTEIRSRRDRRQPKQAIAVSTAP